MIELWQPVYQGLVLFSWSHLKLYPHQGKVLYVLINWMLEGFIEKEIPFLYLQKSRYSNR